MNQSSHQKHPGRILAILIGVVLIAAAAIGLSQHSEPASDNTPSVSTASVKQQDTDLVHEGDILDSIVNVPAGTYLVVRSDQENYDVNVQVTENGGFVVEKGAVLVLENVNFSGDGQERSMPVFSVYGDMVMNGGTVENFSGTSSGTASDYGTGGVPAICVVDGTFTMNGGVISGNTSTTTKEIAFGGALRAEGSNAAVIINDGTISGNKVLSSAIVPDDSTVTANALGGAIAVTEGASVTINGGEISNNTAGSHDANGEDADNPVCSGNGGAIAVYSSDSDAISSIYLDGGSIENNNAYRTGADQGAEAPDNNETHGGGIFSNVYTKAVLNSGRIAGNTSDDKGGGVFLDCAKSSGGALFKNTLVSDNEAESLGGGLWFCPDGEADMFSDAKADGIAIFDNTTSKRGTDGAGDDIYVSPRSGDTGVTVTGTMPGGGSNAWYQDGGAGTQKTSGSSSRYSSSDTSESATLLQANAVINVPSLKAKDNALKATTVVITGNHATYGGGVGSNHYLSFGTPTSEEKKEHNVPSETTEPEKISINVNKVWVGDAGTEATVHLFANGKEAASAVLNEGNSWKYTFTNLDQADSDGNKIQYTVTEDTIDVYASEITGDAENGFTVTNTKASAVTSDSLPVQKIITGDTPEKDSDFTFVFTADRANSTLPDGMSTMPMPGGVSEQETTKTVTGAGTVSFDGISFEAPGTYVYQLTERNSGEPGYTYDTTSYMVTYTVTASNGTLSVSRKVVKNGQTENTNAVFTNSYQTPASDTGVISGNKTLTQDGQALPIKDGQFKVKIEADSGNDSSGYSGFTEGTYDVAANGSFTTQEITFNKAGTYRFHVSEEDGGDARYTYDDSNYMVTFVVTNGSDNQLSVQKTITDDDGNVATEILFRNTRVAEQEDTDNGLTVSDPPVKKEITGDTPDQESEFVFTLTAVPEESSLPAAVSADSMPMPENAAGNQTMEVKITGAGEVEFGDITFTYAGTYVYRIVEKDTGETGYTYDDTVYTVTYEVSETSGGLSCVRTISKNGETVESVVVTPDQEEDSSALTFVNQYQKQNVNEPEKTSVTVTKKWVGDEGSSATVHLFANGTKVDSATLTAADDWTYTFTDLDQADSDGNNITYTLTEDAINGYESSVTGDASNGFTVTNTETIDITGTKVWNDNEDQDGLRPDSVTISLLRDGTEIDTATVKADEDGTWSFAFKDLPKYDATDGSKYNYTVAETSASDDYTSTVTGDVDSGFTITNTHEPATTSVSVLKAWDDSDDQDGLRPGSVTVQLYANGEASGDAVKLSNDNEWKYTWTGLDAYANGKKISYIVDEKDVPEGYTSEVTGDAASGFTITNKHTPETTSVSVAKVWNDGGDQDGLRPDSVTVQLKANGNSSGDAIVLSADNSWTYTWEDLNKYSNGEKIKYSVKETKVSDGYTAAVSGDATSGFTITNTHTPETTSVSVSKKWIGPAGTSATFALYADDTDTGKTLTLSAENNWKGSFDGLAKYKNGIKITYTVKETGMSGVDASNYSTTVSGDASSGYIFTNTSNAKVGVRVIKDWRGMPEPVTVNLYGQAGSDDAVLVKSVTLDGVAGTLSSDSDTGVEYGEDDEWVAVFTGLPKYDSQTGAEITYSVTEAAVSETSSVVSEPTTEGDVTTFTITNTRSATFHPTVTKVWSEGVVSKAVTIQLKQGDDVIDEITLDGEPDESAAASDTEKGEYDAWQGRFKAVDKFDDHGAPIEYTVNEVTTGDWKSSVSGNERTGFTVQNAPLGATSATLAASKTVNGGEVGSSAFSFELYEGDSATGTPLQTVQNDHNGKITFAPIVYTTSGTHTYTIVEKDESATDITYDSSVYTATVEVADANNDGSLDTPTITYSKDGQVVSDAAFDNTVVTRTSVSFTKEWVGKAGESATVRLMRSTNGGEAEDTGLSVTVDGTADSLTTDSDTGAKYGEDAAWHGTFENLVASDRGHTYSYTLVEDAVDGYASSSSGDASEGYVFTNTELTSVSVSKEWVGPVGTSATFALYADGTDTGKTLTLTADDGWSGSFSNLAKYSNGTEIAYTVKETGMSGVNASNYSTTVSGDASTGYTFTNTNIETVDISGTKVWNDSDDQDGLRPDSITVNLLRNGTEVASTMVTADSDDTWAFSFADMAKYDSDGNKYTYTVTEKDVLDDYTSVVTGNATSGFTITNTHTPETTSVSVSKEWVGPAGTSATFALYADGTDTGKTLTLTAADGWSGSFGNLAKYKNGKEIAYTVSETGMGGVDSSNYSTTSSGSASDGYTFTNTNTETVDVSGTKVWDDASDQDDKRPDSVTVSLLRDGTEVDTATVTDDGDDTWSFSFDDLAKYDSTDGHEYTYTVAEATVPDGYTSSVSGFTITNSHTPETTSVSVSKSWVGPAGTSATFALYADNVDTGMTLTLTADDSWSGSFDDLAKYKNGKEIAYTVSETGMGGVDSSNYSTTSSGSASEGYTFTNTNTETVDVSGTKVWDDASDQDGKRPDSVTVSLLRDGTEVDTATVTDDGDDTWSFSFDDLAKYDSTDGHEYAYTMAEATVPDGYTSSVSGFTITNTHTPETTSVSVTKKWIGPAGTSATFALYANGSDTGKTLTLNADNGWTGSFTSLDKYNSGAEVAYTVSETTMGGVDASNYSTTVSGDAASGYTFTNTNTETVTVHVQKYWTPSWQGEASVVVQLYSGGKATGSKLTLVRDENDTVNYGWNGDFSNLPKYDSNGDEIKYTVVEEEVYWPNDSTNYREYYGCTQNYTTLGNTITYTLWNEFGGGDG